jgi:C-terminal processing protease CtpA/Prc
MLTVRLPALALVLLLAVALGAIAGGRGFFGFSLAVELDGSATNPLLRKVKVVKVLTASPAANAGIQRGDVIVEVEGRAVAGGKALELQSLMRREVGPPLRLRVQRGSAEPFSVTLVADVARPE